MYFKKHLVALALSSLWLTACSSSYVSVQQQPPQLPDSWAAQASSQALSNSGLSALHTPPLQAAIRQALANNHQLQQAWYGLQASRQDAVIIGARLWPELGLSLNASRNRTAAEPNRYASNGTLSATLSYELDVWGKLSDAERQANLNLAAAQADYRQQQQQLVADVTLAWYQLVQQQRLVSLAEQQLQVTSENLDIIQRGYKQGLNAALDVYLARNAVASEQSALAEQQRSQQQAIRSLERLLGRYPAAAMQVDNIQLPDVAQAIPAGLPSELITRNPALQSQWLSVLALDAGVAYAHKQRFPGLSLTASVNNSSSELSDLLSLSDIGWSLLGSATAPLFQGGRLKAQQQKAQAQLRQAEQRYLDRLYATFAEVENGLTSADKLLASFQATEQAAQNAGVAETLSFEQYRKGLVSYTTVLDAQSRAFSAQRTLIQLNYQLLENRVRLMMALGGDFVSAYSQESQQDAS